MQQSASRAFQPASCFPTEQQRLDAMKELAYGASHEINNPLANIAARAQTLLRDEENDQRRHALQAIHRQALRAHEMISDLMLFARPPALVFKTFDLCQLISQLADEIAEPCADREIQLACHLPDAPEPCDADAEQLAVAIKALCTNSIEAIGSGGQIDISIRREPNLLASVEPAKQVAATSPEARAIGSDESTDSVLKQNQDNLVIEVADNGPGISDEIRPHLFDPFFSGREAGRGLGFGLSKCWRIVTEHGGTIEAANHCEPGALFTICLPAKGDSHGQSE